MKKNSLGDLRTAPATSNAPWPAVLIPDSQNVEITMEHKHSQLGLSLKPREIINSSACCSCTSSERWSWHNHLRKHQLSLTTQFKHQAFSFPEQVSVGSDLENKHRMRMDFSPPPHTNISYGLRILLLPHWTVALHNKPQKNWECQVSFFKGRHFI